MKTRNVLFVAGIALATVFSSCQKESYKVDNGDSDRICTVSFNAVGNGTKTTVDGLEVKWKDTGETIRMDCIGYEKVGDVYTKIASKNKKGSSPVVSSDKKSASFNVAIAEITGSANCFDYLIGYPYDSFQSVYDRSGDTKSNYTVPSEQTPGDDFDDNASIMIAKSLERATQGGSLGSIEFSHVVAFANLSIINLNCGTETVSNVKFTATGKDVAGKHSYNYISGAITNSESTVKDAVTVTVSPVSTSSFDVRFNLSPIAFSSGDKFKVVITTNAHTYTREITLDETQAAALHFDAGVKTNFTVDFNGISADAPLPSYEKYTTSGTAIPEGDYIIYAGGVAMKSVISSDRFSYETVTVTDNKIMTDDATIIWHISGTAGNYLIYNASVNKYAASTGVKNQGALISPSSPVDAKCYWTISNSSTSATITNNSNQTGGVNCNLRRNSTSGFATYGSSTGTAPVLYKKK